MITQPRIDGGTEDVRFTATINERPVTIVVGRETIEDHAESAEGMSDAERIAYVGDRQQRLTAKVADYLRTAPDADGIRVTADMLD